MVYPHITQAASNGDDRAIAQLIAIALPDRPKTFVRLTDDCLTIELITDHRLNQTDTIKAIADVITSLHLRFAQIHIANYLPHETSPLWQETVALAGKHRTPRRIPQWLAAKPNLATYSKLIKQNFDLNRLAIVIPFILYGFVCAKHYNVADFLSGQQRLIQFLHGANLIFHEAGHILFMVFGQFMAILGGSLNQILIPTMISGYFFYKRQYFSGSVTLFWVGENFWDVSIYASDARDTILPLLGGDGTIHDWNWLLTTLGWIPYTKIVGSLLYGVGTVIYIGAIGLALYFARRQFSPRSH